MRPIRQLFRLLIISAVFALSGHPAFASSEAIRKTLQACLNQPGSDSNPGSIECTSKATLRAEREINEQAKRIKQQLHGVSAHGVKLAGLRAYIDAEIQDFRRYRYSASLASFALNEGTGSDNQAASSQANAELTLAELARLEAINP